jgi:hypothetical protein
MSGQATSRRAGASSADAAPVLLFAVFVAGILTSYQLGDGVQTAFLVGMLVITLVIPLLRWLMADADLSAFLLIPTILSASQNVFLLAIADDISQSQLQFVIILNFAYALILALSLAFFTHREPGVAHRTGLIRAMLWCAGILTAYGVISLGLFGANITSALASYRNLITPFLFLLIGLWASRTTLAAGFLRGVVILGTAAVGFGFFEWATPGFWQSTDLDVLWAKKGIQVAQSTGLPSNFFSSEQIDGALVRRMASSFADPVNFGTFLFIAFLGAWFLGHRLLAILFIVASVIAVSKGAMLGFLVFFAFWTRYNTPRALHYLALAAAALAGVAFLVFSADNSTGSTGAHIGGFTAAFTELPQHPLGRGLGNVGVLASLFSEASGSEIRESGLGVVIGQLGVVGLGGYTAFFVILIRSGLRLSDPRARLLVLGAVVGFALNMMFNEVALSPNSAAPYFVAIGLVLGRAHVRSGAEPPAAAAQRPLPIGVMN